MLKNNNKKSPPFSQTEVIKTNNITLNFYMTLFTFIK